MTKPCPFCGHDRIRSEVSRDRSKVRPVCEGCGAKGPAIAVPTQPPALPGGYSYALAAWNDRREPVPA